MDAAVNIATPYWTGFFCYGLFVEFEKISVKHTAQQFVAY